MFALSLKFIWLWIRGREDGDSGRTGQQRWRLPSDLSRTAQTTKKPITHKFSQSQLAFNEWHSQWHWSKNNIWCAFPLYLLFVTQFTRQANQQFPGTTPSNWGSLWLWDSTSSIILISLTFDYYSSSTAWCDSCICG